MIMRPFSIKDKLFACPTGAAPIQAGEHHCPRYQRVTQLPSEAVAEQPPDTIAAPRDLPLLDLSILFDLERVLSRNELRNLISLYLVDLDNHLARITECRLRNNFDGVSLTAHIIGTTAGNLGAMQTSAMARQLETACRFGDNGLTVQLIEELNASCASSSWAMRIWSSADLPSTQSAIAS
jgi:HPt (histidine-containing phosphotransfer) domain-containing protein